jgi:transposase
MTYITGWRYPMRPPGKAAILEERRLRAIRLFESGHPPVEVARILGVGRRSVRRWKSIHRKRGISGIRSRPNFGRPPRLDSRKRYRLEQILLKGAHGAGFETDLWTCPRVVHVINETFGIRYHVDHIGRLLHSLGWSPQKPERRALERNERHIRTWKRIHWPRIKKKSSD